MNRLGKPTRSLAGSLPMELPWPSAIHQPGATPMAPEFTCQRIRRWPGELGARTLFIEPGTLCENGYIESFIGKLRDELLNREIFYTLQEAQALVERWRQMYNGRSPHSALGNGPPASQAYLAPGLGSPLTTETAFGLTKNLVQRMGAGQQRNQDDPQEPRVLQEGQGPRAHVV